MRSARSSLAPLAATLADTVVAILVAGAALLPAQDRWRVRCVAPDGTPVEGAEVWVFQNEPRPDGSSYYPTAGPFTSGADGWASTVVARTYGGGRFYRWVFARVSGELVGTVICSRPEAQPVVRLQPAVAMRGRVTVPEGYEPTTVVVRVASLAETVDGRLAKFYPRASNFPGLEDALPAIFDRRPAADGGFEFTDLPRGARVTFITEGAGLAHAQWCNTPGFGGVVPDSLTIDIPRESVLEGRVLAPDGEPVADAEVGVRFVDDRASYRWSCSTRTSREGRYRLTGLPTGVLGVTVTTAAGHRRPYRFRMPPRTVQGDVVQQLEPGIELRGLVVDEEGRPIEKVTVVAQTQSNDGDRLGATATDPQGRFALTLPTGDAYLYLGYVPGGWDRQRTESARQLVVQPDDPGLRAIQFDIVRR